VGSGNKRVSLCIEIWN